MSRFDLGLKAICQGDQYPKITN